jgi:hypothetical protein
VERLRRAENPYRFTIPDDLVPQLRRLRARQRKWSEVIDAEDVVHLYYGLGPAMFLAFDGRVLVDDSFNETGCYEVSDPKEAWVALAVGANVWSFPELLRLLPERPSGALDCPDCRGVGWLFFPTSDGRQCKVVCRGCGALGWLGPCREG